MAGLGIEAPRHTNEHNIYVRTGVATYQQLSMSVEEFKKLMKASSDPRIKEVANTEIEVNLVTNMSGVSNMSGYLWAESPIVYYLLCGRNPDGSERIEEIETEEQEEEEDDEELLGLKGKSGFNLNSSFKFKVEKPKIIKKLPPLIPFPGYEYTPEQRAVNHKYLVEQEKILAEKENREPREIPVQPFGYFILEESHTPTLDADKNPRLLRGEVPKWVTSRILYDKFAKFAMKKADDYSKGKQIKEKDIYGVEHDVFTYGTYFRIHMYNNPVRGRENDRVVCIEYSQSINATGIFAIQMRRKTVFINPKPTCEEDKQAICIFDYFRNKVNYAALASDKTPPSGRYGSPRGSSFFNRSTDTGFSTRAVGGAGAPSDDGFQSVKRR
jgi:hypothetical protein